MYCFNCGNEISSEVLSQCGTKQTQNIAFDKINNVNIKVDDKCNSTNGKRIVKRLLKEIFILVLIIGISFLVKYLSFFILNSIPYPEVSEETQNRVNEIYRQRQAENSHASSIDITDISLELGYGSYKYDFELSDSDSLTHINESRKRLRQNHAENISNIIFLIFLAALPLVRYVIILIKWLKS